MNRRDLIKAALAVPILNATRGWTSICSGSGPCLSPTRVFSLYLEGPFGIVLHKGTGNLPNVTGITAFMPNDPSGRHKFAIQKKPQDVSKQYSFAFSQINPPAQNFLCIDSAFSDFCVDSTSWSKDATPRLLTLELAVPTRIRALSSSIPVVVQSSKSRSWQRAFLFEYDLDISGLQLTDTVTGQSTPLTVSSYRFEIGLDHNDPDASGLPHAKDFFNKTLLAFFPDLQNNPDYIVKQASNQPKELHQSKKPGGPAGAKTTTYECKSGGIIGGNP